MDKKPGFPENRISTEQVPGWFMCMVYVWATAAVLTILGYAYLAIV